LIEKVKQIILNKIRDKNLYDANEIFQATTFIMDTMLKNELINVLSTAEDKSKIIESISYNIDLNNEDLNKIINISNITDGGVKLSILDLLLNNCNYEKITNLPEIVLSLKGILETVDKDNYSRLDDLRLMLKYLKI
jgi:hypothetical protein